MDQKGNHILTDRILVERVLAGNSRAFGIIVRNTEGLVAHILFKMIPGAEDRRDIAQDIYLKVFQKLGSFRFQAKLSTWIARIAYNSCINHLEKSRTSGRFELLPEIAADHHPDPLFAEDFENKLHEAELAILLQTEIDRLPPMYKLLITLFHQQELSYQEIAQIVSLPEGTIKSYLFRARKILKDQLQIIYQKGL